MTNIVAYVAIPTVIHIATQFIAWVACNPFPGLYGHC